MIGNKDRLSWSLWTEIGFRVILLSMGILLVVI